MKYRRMLYIFAIYYKTNHFKMYMFGVVGETHAHDYFEFHGSTTAGFTGYQNANNNLYSVQTI